MVEREAEGGETGKAASSKGTRARRPVARGREQGNAVSATTHLANAMPQMLRQEHNGVAAFYWYLCRLASSPAETRLEVPSTIR